MASRELRRIVEIAGSASDRFGLWTAVTGAFRFRDVCEIGVYEGDHTLRGITIDLVNLLPKMRKGGVIAGDDFVKNIWQHGMRYSPTEVHPFALYFAEAQGLPFASLPFEQFCIVNDSSAGFEWVDRGGYAKLDPVSVNSLPRVSILERWKRKWLGR